MNHVALLIPGLDRIAGAEQQVILLAKGLHARGWRVSVVALSGCGGEAKLELNAAGINFISLEMRKGLIDPRGWLHFHKWLKRDEPDVVHAHLPHAAWMARWSRLAAPVRVVMDTVHSCSTGTLGRRIGYRCSDWLTDQVTAVSRPAANAHRDALMATQGKLTVMPNGVDMQLWRPDPTVRDAVRSELQIDGEFLWFAAGRLDAVKDYPTLLRAMSNLPASARLVIAGSGPLQAELLSLTAELGLDQRVRFLGFQKDVLRWMQAADGFVLSSRWEGLPMCLIEAGACSLPAVATDVPGVREVIVNGETGLLALAANSAALAAAMARLMQMPAEARNAMGERARERVLKHYNLDRILDRWEALYADLLQRNREPRRWARTRSTD